MDDNSFNSIDRLVEFGLGVAVANQMIATMNACIGGMRVPGGDNPMMARRKSARAMKPRLPSISDVALCRRKH